MAALSKIADKKQKRKNTTSNLQQIQNAAKTMFANIRFQSIDKDLKTLLMTSSVPDEGKTTTAWYLAQAAATAGNRVLLVEADMRRRSLAHMLGLHPKNGIVSVLTGTAQLRDAIVPTSVQDLFFMDAEPSVPNPADLLASKRMAKLNEHLATQFDYVLYDTPPVGTFVDAAVLGRIVDGAILCVRSSGPKRQELMQAYEQLAKADVNILGICSTFTESSGSEYYYSYYYNEEHTKHKGKVALEAVPQRELPDELTSTQEPSRTSSPASSRANARSGRSVPRVPAIEVTEDAEAADDAR